MFKWLFSISITEEWNDLQELCERQNTDGMYKYTPEVYKQFIYALIVRMVLSVVRDGILIAALIKLLLL